MLSIMSRSFPSKATHLHGTVQVESVGTSLGLQDLEDANVSEHGVVERHLMYHEARERESRGTTTTDHPTNEALPRRCKLATCFASLHATSRRRDGCTVKTSPSLRPFTKVRYEFSNVLSVDLAGRISLCEMSSNQKSEEDRLRRCPRQVAAHSCCWKAEIDAERPRSAPGWSPT